MAEVEKWTDLLDPDEDEIRRHAPATLLPDALSQLARRPAASSHTRPTLQAHGEYVFGVLLLPVAVPERDRVFYQEIGLVLTAEAIMTVRKTPHGEPPFDATPVREVCAARGPVSTGRIAYYLVDEAAERYIDLADVLDDEIDELEEHVDTWPAERIHRRTTELRHDLLQIRRMLAPMRDAVRAVVDGRVDIRRRPLSRREVFSRDVEVLFAGAYDKLLRSSEALEFSRDLLAAVRDYHQSLVANEQNEVVKRLTAIASLLLFPTFWVGVYGQNFEHMPELRWQLGYLWSWGVIVGVTVLQLIMFRRKRWL